MSLHYVRSAVPDEYVIEIRRGSTRACIGRVVKYGQDWAALGVGLTSWTDYVPTRAEAVRRIQVEQADVARTSNIQRIVAALPPPSPQARAQLALLLVRVDQ